MKKSFFTALLSIGILNADQHLPIDYVSQVFETVNELFVEEGLISTAILRMNEISRELAHTPFHQNSTNILDTLIEVLDIDLSFEEAEIRIYQELALLDLKIRNL